MQFSVESGMGILRHNLLKRATLGPHSHTVTVTHADGVGSSAIQLDLVRDRADRGDRGQIHKTCNCKTQLTKNVCRMNLPRSPRSRRSPIHSGAWHNAMRTFDRTPPAEPLRLCLVSPGRSSGGPTSTGGLRPRCSPPPPTVVPYPYHHVSRDRAVT